MGTGRRAAAAAGVTLVLAAAALPACSGRAEPTATRSQAQAQATGAPGGSASQAAPLVAADVTRKVVSTATLRIEVRDVGRTTAEAGRLAVAAGGFVAGSEETGAPDERRARVTLKVPGDRFDELVGAVAALGEVRSKQVGTEDVTEQVVDLEARLRAARAASERLQQLIARAATVAEVVSVESELARRTSEVESLEGRLRVLRDRVDLATVTVNLSPPQPEADDALPGFLSGLRGGWRALRATAILGSAALGALLPWLVPLALIVVAARLGGRRWRRRHPARYGPLPPPSWGDEVPSAHATAPGPPPPPAQEQRQDSGPDGDL